MAAAAYNHTIASAYLITYILFNQTTQDFSTLLLSMDDWILDIRKGRLPYLFLRKIYFYFSGICVCGAGVGTFVVSPLEATLLSQLGWRGTLRVLSAIAASCLFLSALMVPVPADHTSHTDGGRDQEWIFLSQSCNLDLCNTTCRAKIGVYYWIALVLLKQYLGKSCLENLKKSL